jgi:hypothetical protein
MRIAALTLEQLDAATAHWPLERDALMGRLRWHLCTPGAFAQMAVTPMGIAAVGAAIGHGSSGWITVLRALLPEAYAPLALSLATRLESEGCRSQSIITPAEYVAALVALGFTIQDEMMWCSGGTFLQATHEQVQPLEARHRLALQHLHRRATGEDRTDLLWEHQYLGRVYESGGQVHGFLLPLLGDGLIVATSTHAGLELQRWLLPVQDHVVLPGLNTAAIEHLELQGFHSTTAGVRMVRGEALLAWPQMIFAWPW